MNDDMMHSRNLILKFWDVTEATWLSTMIPSGHRCYVGPQAEYAQHHPSVQNLSERKYHLNT
jgi:hypothetical protein